MYELRDVLLPFMLIILTIFLLFFFTNNKPSSSKTSKPSMTKSHTLPKPHPIIGHLLAFAGLTGQEIFEWLSKLITYSPTSTIVIHQPFGGQSVYTGDPANVEHILKTNFNIYQKGRQFKTVFGDLFGGSLFTEDGDKWKFQRQILAQQFTYKSLQKFVEQALEFEVNERLIPILQDAAKNNKVVDLQDLLQRFAFDNVCTVAFGYDPGYLSLPLPEAKFTEAFDECMTICHERFHAVFPTIWKACRFLNIGSEKRLKELIKMIREFCGTMLESTKQKRSSNQKSNTQENNNLLAKLLECDQYDDDIVIDIVIGFILAGRDTSSSVLTWFFWLMHQNKQIENRIIQEIICYKQHIENGNLKNNSNSNNNSINSSSSLMLEALKGMTYTHATLSETMRLYPPVPVDMKQAAVDDILPDGTKVRKGSIVGYFAQSMGWSEKLWGKDWAEFCPERWLKTDTETGRVSFVPRDAYSYPVFLAGPRTCLGKEMAYLQMKSVVAAILSRFKVIPVVPEGFEPVYFIETVAVMHGGFPVRIEEKI